MATSATTKPTIAETQALIDQAEQASADADRELASADAEVEAARERQGLGIAARGLTIKAQVARSRRHEAALVARGRLSGLTKLLSAQRDQEAAVRARAASDRRLAFLAEAAVLNGRAADLIAATQAALDDLEHEYRDLNSRSGGQLLSQAAAPSFWPRINGELLGSLGQLARFYATLPKPAATKTNGGGNA